MKKFTMLVAVLATVGLSACGGTDDKPRSLNGIWKSNDPSMIANISNGEIQIDFVNGDDEALYWTGTFDKSSVSNGAEIVSDGDTKAMDVTLLASQDDTKKFTYKDGKLSFFFSIRGVSQTVKLEQ